MQRISDLYGKLLAGLALLGCVLLFLMMLAICTDVLLRNVAILPSMRGLAWSNEISESILAFVTMLAAPWLLRRGQHIRVDILLVVVPAKLAWRLEWVADAAALACCVVMTWYGWQAAAASFRAGAMSVKTLITPEWWYLAPLPVTFALLALEVLFRMRRLYLGERAPRGDAVSTG